MTSIPVSVNYDEQLGKNASTSLFLSVHFTCSTGLLCLLLYLKHLNGYAFRLTKALDNRVAFTWVGLPVAFFPTILISLLGSSRVSHPRVGLACVLQQRHLVPGPGKRYISSDPRRQYSSKASTAPEALNLEHSQFLSEAPPNAKWNGGMNNGERSVDELEGVEDGRGKLLPTSSHLFKLIVPLGNLSRPGNTRRIPTPAEHRDHAKSSVPPTVYLLHPAQPLSHASRLIVSSLAPAHPVVSFRSVSVHGRAFQWSESTDIGDFIRDAARSAQFFICLTYEPSERVAKSVLEQSSAKYVTTNQEGETKGLEGEDDPTEVVIEIQVPTFADRTRYLRRRLNVVERQIEEMTELKGICDREAHKGARRMALSGFGGLVVYWAAVARLTFWDYGWDVMEPVTYLSGLSMVILGYLWFLYQGREVSYSSVLAQSISNRRNNLYKARGFDVERWADLTAERKALRKEIGRIAEDYEEIKGNEFDEGEGEREGDGHGGNPGAGSTGLKDETIGKRMASKADRED